MLFQLSYVRHVSVRNHPKASRLVSTAATMRNRLAQRPGGWERLSATLQEYLAAVVAELDRDGKASTGAVAQRMGRPATQVAKQRDALIVQHQLLQPAGRGYVSLALPGMDEWVRRQ